MGQNLALMAWPSLIIFSTIASDRTIVNDHVETNLIAELNKAYVKKKIIIYYRHLNCGLRLFRLH